MFPFCNVSLPHTTHSRGLQRRWLRSLTECRGISPPKHPISALLHRLSRSGLNYGSFREEPAISSLDWPFTPIPRSEERFARQYPFRPPSLWREISPCPGIDRLVSGLKAVTPGAFTPRPSPKAADVLVSLKLRSFNFLVSPLL